VALSVTEYFDWRYRRICRYTMKRYYVIVSGIFNPFLGDGNVDSRFARGGASFTQVSGVVENATDAGGSASAGEGGAGVDGAVRGADRGPEVGGAGGAGSAM
jgi:hypothetical protein